MGRRGKFFNVLLRQVLNRSFAFSIFSPASTASLRLTVAVQLIVSVFFLTVGTSFFITNLPSTKWLVCCWSVVEVLFFVVNTYRIRVLNRQVNFQRPSDDQIIQTFDKFLKSMQHVDCAEHLRDWFFNRSFGSVPRQNVVDLVAYGLGHRNRDELRSKETNALFPALLEKLELQESLSFQQGYDPKIKFKWHLWDDLRALHYPLIAYLLVEVLGLVFGCLMESIGFVSEPSKVGRRYWKMSDSKEKLEPIVFLHGLGMGSMVYIPFLKLLGELGHPILFLEMRQLSFRCGWTNLSIDQVASELRNFLFSLEYEKCHIVGHSFGTFIASRFWSLHPESLSSLSLIDPVCCVMHNPKLLSNFVYRKISFAGLKQFIESFLIWILSHDPCIAATVSRGFLWTLLILWPEEIPQNTLLVLSEADSLVPVNDIKQIFHLSAANILCHPSHHHAGFVFDFKWQQTILSSLKQNLDMLSKP